MAKQGDGVTPEAASRSPEVITAVSTPMPPALLSHTTITLPAGTVLHRVHSDQYGADEFNSSSLGNARFSPIYDGEGTIIPTLYGGSTIECALMETIFHDVPHTSGQKMVAKSILNGRALSTLLVTRDLELVDLASVALRKLGVARRQLIDTEKDQYPATRRWAEAFFRHSPVIQGLSWISRQDDSARPSSFSGAECPVIRYVALKPRVVWLMTAPSTDTCLNLRRA